MGKVTRELVFESKSKVEEFLKKEYDLNFKIDPETTEYKNQELKTVLVNLYITQTKDKEVLSISKLVTLRAFLLGKEEGMDVVKLIATIDDVMKLSSDGVKAKSLGILDDKNLEEFLEKANISIETKLEDKVILSDGKRSVSIDYNNNTYEFNSISLIEY